MRGENSGTRQPCQVDVAALRVFRYKNQPQIPLHDQRHSSMDNIIGFIFARGGSKGVPRKNLRLLDGKPLIAHAIEAALQTHSLERVVVSTDCPQIAEAAQQYGAEVPFLRPDELASDRAPERLAWRHAVEYMEALEEKRIDIFVSIPPTCPLRIPEDIDHCIEELVQTDADIVLTTTEADCNPYFNMVTRDESGWVELAMKNGGKPTRRQDAPPIFELTAVAYAARRDPLFMHDSIFQSQARSIVIPKERAIDIDTEFDLEIAEFFMNRRKSQPLFHRTAA